MSSLMAHPPLGSYPGRHGGTPRAIAHEVSVVVREWAPAVPAVFEVRSNCPGSQCQCSVARELSHVDWRLSALLASSRVTPVARDYVKAGPNSKAPRAPRAPRANECWAGDVPFEAWSTCVVRDARLQGHEAASAGSTIASCSANQEAG